MISIFNVRGYLGRDPLDDQSTLARYGITIAVAAIVNTLFLYVIFNVLGVAELRYGWLFWVEVAVLSLLYVPAITTVRKSSSIVLMLMLAAIGIPLDLYIENAFRQTGAIALWTYSPDGLLGPLHPILQILAVWLGDALVAGPIVLWISRLVASLIKSSAAKPYVSEAEYEGLFPASWSNEGVDKPSRDFSYYALRILALVYIGYLGLLLLSFLGTAVYPAPIRDFLDMTNCNPALTVNTYIKICLMVALALTGAYNKSLRFHAGLVLLVAHAVSTIISLVLYYTTPTNPYHMYLMASALADTGLVVLFGIVMYLGREAAALHKKKREYPEYYSVANRLTQLFYYIYGGTVCLIVPGIIAIRYLMDGSDGWGAVYGFPDPQLANTITKYSTLTLLAWLIAQRETLRETLGKAIVFGYSVSVIASGIWLLFGGMLGDVSIATRVGTHVTEDWYFMLNVLMDGGVVVLILSLRKMYYTVEYTINAINPSSARAVLGMHDALWDGDTKGRQEALTSIDKHVAGMRGRKRGLLNFPFWILEHVMVFMYGLHPGFSSMDAANQRFFLRTYVLRPPGERRRSYIPELAEGMYRLGNAMHALISLSHYTSRSAQAGINYIPPDARERMQADVATDAPPGAVPAALPKGPGDPLNYKPSTASNAAPLVAPRVVTPVDDPEAPDDVDYIILGSGAGAAVMAYRLACQVKDPSRILVIERGPRFSPLQDFNADEMEMVRKLYKEGGLQMSKRFDLMMLQGECVGGTTIVNNAVCLEMPTTMSNAWATDYNITLTNLATHYAQVKSELGISPIPSTGINTRVRDVFDKGVAGYNASAQPAQQLIVKKLEANMRNEDGDGLLNIGNHRMRKMSMLETYLPWAESRGVRVVSNTSGVRIIADGSKATGVLVRNRIGAMKIVKARKAVIVACGAVASSHVLMRSKLDKVRNASPAMVAAASNVGRHLSCNFAFPVALEFPHVLDAFDGTQITLGVGPSSGEAVFETYFNPPGAFSISQPFYFGHQRNLMTNYNKVVNFGALVGSEPNGVVQPQADILDGRAFTWELGNRDIKNIKYAIKTLLDLGRHAGATHAALPMEPGLRIPLDASSISSWKSKLDTYSLSMADLRLTTAHPQGGNRMTGPGKEHDGNRVVNEQFLVDGMDNVYVTDASIFPIGITVNPQWTILALSSMAAEHVIGNTTP